MQFIDLQAQYRNLKEDIDQTIQTVLNGSNFIMGKQVSELELQLADYVGMKHCITCGNGTDALKLILMAYGIQAGDAVFVPDFTFFATAEAVSSCGAYPVFVDVNRDTFNISSKDLEKAISEIINQKKYRPRAIMTVDLFGLPCDYSAINDIAQRYNLLVIEDCAQGFGSSYKNKKGCALGDVSATSFFPTKPLGCYGDGGAVFTNEDRVMEYVQSLKVHGKGTDKYDNVLIGMNSRLDTIQAAILLIKLKAFRQYELESRIRVAELYNEKLNGAVKVPHIPEECRSSYALYSVLFENELQRDQVQQALKENSVPSMIYYKKLIHQQAAYRNNASIYRNFENSIDISKRILSLPMDPYLEEAQITKICSIIKKSI